MADLLKAARDPKFREDVLRGLGETFARGVAGVAGTPVDLTTMAMRPFGYNVPPEQVVGSSEYLGKQMESAGMISSARNPAAEFLAGIVTPDPMDMAKLGAMAVPVVGRAVKGLEGIKNEASQTPFIDFMNENVSDVLPAHVKAGILPKTQAHDVVDIDKLTPSEYDAFGEILSSPSSMKKIEELRKAENLPPVLIKGTQEDAKYLPQVIDGHHRTMASILNLKHKIPVSYDAETLAQIWKEQNKSDIPTKELVKKFESSLSKKNEELGAADPRLLGTVGAGTAVGLSAANKSQKEEEQPRPVFGYRPDGTPKGYGWLGVLPTSDGNVATEYSMQSQAVKVGDKMVDFPTLVPGLTQDEVQMMVNDIIPNRKPIPEEIVQKAIRHAKQRIDKGLSPFLELGE